MNTNIPDDLMDNVERKLRKHVKDKKKKKRMYIAAASIISFFIILPISVYAYSQYNDSVPFKQEIDLARQNNNITKINKDFKYKNVSFTIKEILADDTGMEVIYDVSDPKYAVNGVGFSGVNNNCFGSWGYSHPQTDENSTEKAFNIVFDKSTAQYVKNNPIKIKISSISYKGSNGVIDKIKDMEGDKTLKVDWNLKMKVPVQVTKIIPVNKEYKLDIGTLKIKDLKEGILQTTIESDFTPSNSDIKYMGPIFSIRLDKEYTSNFGKEDSISSMQGQTFESIYYKNVKQIGIRLIGATVDYEFDNSKTYEVNKDKLPMEFNYNGDKFKIVSMKDGKESTEYTIECSKENRTYDDLEIGFGNGSGGQDLNGKIQYKDSANREKIYKSLSQKIPKSVLLPKEFINTGAVGYKLTTHVKGERKFKIWGAYRRIIYDEDEIVINNPF